MQRFKHLPVSALINVEVCQISVLRHDTKHVVILLQPFMQVIWEYFNPRIVLIATVDV